MSIIGWSLLSEPQHCQVVMVRTLRAQKFPVKSGKPYTWQLKSRARKSPMKSRKPHTW